MTADDLTGNGAVWLRTDIERTEPATAALGLELGAIEGFDSIYWNGELLTSLDYRDYPGSGYLRRWGKYSVPAEKVKVGKNTLAIRVYAPAGPAKFPAAPKIGGKVPTEASGGVRLDTIRDIGATGVTYVSVGRLTQSAPAADIGLDFALA